MNNIFTSYYAKAGKFDQSEFKLVCISRGNPVPDLVQDEIEELMPNSKLLRLMKQGNINESQYEELYLKQLDLIGFDKINKIIESKFDGRDLVLFCYEKLPNFCHRHIFAEWWNRHSDNKIIEFSF